MRKEESEKSSCPAIYIWDVNVGEAIHIQFCQCWELTRGWPGDLTPLADTGMSDGRKYFINRGYFVFGDLWNIAIIYLTPDNVISRESCVNKMEHWRRNRPLYSLGSHIFCQGKYFQKYFYYLDGAQRPCSGHEKRMKEETRSVMMMMVMNMMTR